jgi:hypothetical protein
MLADRHQSAFRYSVHPQRCGRSIIERRVIGCARPGSTGTSSPEAGLPVVHKEVVDCSDKPRGSRPILRLSQYSVISCDMFPRSDCKQPSSPECAR